MLRTPQVRIYLILKQGKRPLVFTFWGLLMSVCDFWWRERTTLVCSVFFPLSLLWNRTISASFPPNLSYYSKTIVSYRSFTKWKSAQSISTFGTLTLNKRHRARSWGLQRWLSCGSLLLSNFILVGDGQACNSSHTGQNKTAKWRPSNKTSGGLRHWVPFVHRDFAPVLHQYWLCLG